VSWRRSEQLVPAAVPADGAGFRLGELVVVVPPPGGASRDELAVCVTGAGYEALTGTPDWQHFRPRSVWWHGVRRHARLRLSDLHLSVAGEAHGGHRVRAVGLLTGALEQRFAALGAIYVPDPDVRGEERVTAWAAATARAPRRA
jgi:hypothetical protein